MRTPDRSLADGGTEAGHPLPRRRRRAGRQGRQFVGLRDAGDPVELAERYDAEGADELVFLDITASHEDARDDRRAGARAPPTASSSRSRSAAASARSRTPRRCSRRRRQGLGQHGRARPPGAAERAADHFGAQCVVVAIDAKRTRTRAPIALGWSYVNGGRAADRDATPSPGRARRSSAAPGRSCSPAWTATAPAGYDLELTRAVADAVPVPVIASGGAGRWSTSRRRSRGGADAVLGASIFHYRAHPSARPRSDSPPTASGQTLGRGEVAGCLQRPRGAGGGAGTCLPAVGDRPRTGRGRAGLIWSGAPSTISSSVALWATSIW